MFKFVRGVESNGGDVIQILNSLTVKAILIFNATKIYNPQGLKTEHFSVYIL